MIGLVLIGLIINYGFFPTHAWDIAVAVRNQVQFLNATGAMDGQLSEGMSDVRALAYNAELRRMYFGDKGRDEGSIFSVTVPKNIQGSNHSASVDAVVSKQVHEVQGVAYDDMTGILYWSNGRGHAIMWVKVDITDKAQEGQPLLRLPDQIPIGLAIDHCKRYLYWTNTGSRPSIERSLLDGSERKTIASEDLVMPNAVVVDQSSQRLFWVDERDGMQYRIASSDLEGQDRKVLIEGEDHQPFALAVSAGFVFWADHIFQSVWKLPVDPPPTSLLMPILVAKYSHSPYAVVSAHSDRWTSDNHCNKVVEPSMEVIPATVTKVSSSPILESGASMANNSLSSRPPHCLHDGLWDPERGYCNCVPGYSGELCELDDCTGYCLHGLCRRTASGPTCLCVEGFMGERCETDVCHNYCITGNCSVDILGQPQCHCREGFSGQRCEVNFTQQEELKDKVLEVCRAFCAIWAHSSSQDIIQPFDVCSCQGVQEFHQTTIESHSQCETPFYIVEGLAVVIITLLVIVAYVSRKMCKLSKRPRIKKRIIVNKSVTPLTCRPSPEQCEITIENCCNMNICETPCYEPDFRQPESTLMKSNQKGGKDEKKTLLGNMELPPDDLY